MGKVSKALNKIQDKLTPDSPSTAGQTGSTASPEDNFDQKRDRPQSAQPHQSTKIATQNQQADTSLWNERLIQATRNVTGVAEGIRKLRTMILHGDGRRAIRSVMVLSSDPQEGKSFVCANLGVSFAKSVEHQALLVDCDLRRPSLNTLFGVPGKAGVVDYLENRGNLDNLIQPTGLPKLSIIPSGLPPNNPAELLSSDNMIYLLEELSSRSRDRLLVLDTPPFHAASETILLSQLVDKIVLVVRWGRTGRENIKKMVDTIGREKIIGTVFNGFEMNFLDRRVQGVGYHSYYSEYY